VVLPKNDENITIFVVVSLVNPITEAKSVQSINDLHAQGNGYALSQICVLGFVITKIEAM